ncbi:PAS-domain containing protein [Mesobacterium sp. TK19101]|uniref:PAS-domain containing protein n=1 Tax=Mesobacterium hydrothermale TaxID=3111907 RepID=A0ABU6HGZ5_9RHOB|nr:PAS-domain containing protein [Mesobacterium sp. TK19101]MEC3861596.1 PAS-domain containing protein [Mesobacterium sp. TK19101]
MEMEPAVWGMIALGALGAAAIVLAVTYLFPRGLRARRHDPAPDVTVMAFVLKDDVLLDASDGALGALGLPQDSPIYWRDLWNALTPRFPDLQPDLPDLEKQEFASAGQDATLRIVQRGDRLRVEVSGGARLPLDGQRAAFLDAELARLRAVVQRAPEPIWRTAPDGRVLWANDACEALALDTGEIALVTSQPEDRPEQWRERLADRSNSQADVRWFEVVSRRAGPDTLHWATNIDAVVRAEEAQRNFVQTLTKTFAHLPIGLAIFDRNRQLALFNPALIDLTALPAEFLSGRPNLMTFFDHLREVRMMPEPKNYSGWREQLAELVRATCDDRYTDTWTLPSGLTYKITGRPHPDGAIAFLIEDISAEISLTRRFRAELHQSLAVLDAMSDAYAVFSQLGVLTMSNAAYRALWGNDPDGRMGESTIPDECKDWRSLCEDTPELSELCDTLQQQRLPHPVELTVQHRLRGRVLVRVQAVAGGSLLIRFTARDSLSDGVAPAWSARAAE